MVRVILSVAILALLVAVGMLVCRRCDINIRDYLPGGRTSRDRTQTRAADRLPAQDAPSRPAGTAPPGAPRSPATVVPVAPAVPEIAIGKRTHVVRAGETLWDISSYYYGSPAQVERIADANGLPAPNRVRPGMVLVLPEIPGIRIADPPAAAPPGAVQSEPQQPMPPTLAVPKSVH
jgi:Tfp pilus assembly protein FimV